MPVLGPVTLRGRGIRLEPLRPAHAPGLEAIVDHPEIWPWMPAVLSRQGAVERFVEEALEAEARGTEYTFAVIAQADGRVLGSTRYLDVVPRLRGVEIGWTWYVPDVWGGPVNPEAKLLLLRQAFEVWGAVRVQLKTDNRNLHSQAAIRKLGATYEGTLRRHRLRHDGTFRDSVYFSILDDQWPTVRDGLLARLEDLGPRADATTEA